MVCVLAIQVGACASPAARNDKFALSKGFERSEVSGAEFTHAVYQSKGSATDIWHIYIEGDGTPWKRSHIISADPTPRNPLMLKLMAMDASPAIYLGRPCYHGMVTEPACDPWIWTHGRYSERAVASMSAALDRLISLNSIKQLVLIGHSGGGTLAILLAERTPQTQAVVTLAGNLDIERWAQYHNYSPLTGSLNPVDRPRLPASIVQHHYVGRYDKVITPDIIKNTPRNHTGVELIEVDRVGHTEGWETYYCTVLVSISAECR
ncbi:hypothetical protein MNBD_GAMMA13-1562 [hydrothermal vent metagenome]|uniref:AB hydrolase-1 domain-containing protein n=1 Tax=hydrothermal vent metagenome TaxID=652676 RepID=A0A3B0Y5N0_9ZZZZ